MPVAIVSSVLILSLTVVVVARLFVAELKDQRQTAERVSAASFENAMEALAVVHERVNREQNATLERIVDLVHGPAAVNEAESEPEFRVDIENLPPWEMGEVDEEDWTQHFTDDPVNVVDDGPRAVMARPGEDMVP